ncbi:MAG: hypothetical protein L0177_07435 [Chloroflexi bacterium]|nr:hypothetical protein [Chloroflexota bacterium]
MLVITLFMLGRGWYLALSHGGRFRSAWAMRSALVLALSTALSAALWGLRFAGLLGASPI